MGQAIRRKESQMPTVKVELGRRSYPIVVEAGALRRAGRLIAEQVAPHNVLVVSNPAIAVQHADPLLHSLAEAGIPAHLTLVPPGDRAKSLRNAARLIDVAVARQLERSSAIVALGGGVIGDLAGFVASVYLRGVSLVQVPTSLLAQVDASVGGKTAVNHPSGKNLVGTFYQPRLVVIDPGVLDTLPVRELRAGLAEMIKHGVILDGAYLTLLEANLPALLRRDHAAMTTAVVGSCALKAAVVAADEREAGRRALLNYGHTFGHALEAATAFRRYKHGEAVSIGMEMAARLAQDLGMLSREDAGRQHRLLDAAGLPTRLRGRLPFTAADLLQAMQLDKKVAQGRLRYVLPEGIGCGRVRDDVATPAVAAVLDRFLSGGGSLDG